MHIEGPSARRVEPKSQGVIIYFEGRPIRAQIGDTVAGALELAGVRRLRETPVSRSSRSFYCMMGACFDCLVEIDGEANCQACMTEVKDGLVIRRQLGAAELSL